MKKVYKAVYIILLSIMEIFTCSEIFAITDSFKFAIETVGIPEYNAYGQSINENIYNAYNIFAYGSPEYLDGRHSEQRWKDSKYGLWARYIGKYEGYGTRGEYNLLGQDYSGAVINNYYFPVDKVPNTSPDTWDYCYVPGGLESWQNTNKYKYIEQLDFMKNTKLMFNDISSRDACDNPDKIKEYNITANKIGLNNCRLDVAATWKTNGFVYARRMVNGSARYAVFLTAPMAADADVESSLSLEKSSYRMLDTEDSISILITYGAKIVNMTGYAKKEHIKEMHSEIYVEGKKVSEISGCKIASVGNMYMLVIPRENLIPKIINNISIEINSYAHTEFALDGLMRDTKKGSISVYVEERKVNPIKNVSVKLLEKNDTSLVVRPLAQSYVSNDAKSEGITEAGRYIGVKLELENSGTILDEINVSIDGEKINDKEIKKIDTVLGMKIKLPRNIGATIYGWKSLRDNYGNYFGIAEEDIGKRISSPHELVISYKYSGKNCETKILIDTIDDYISNMNYTLNVSRVDDVQQNSMTFDEWLKE